MTYKQQLELQKKIDERNIEKIISWEKVVRMKDECITLMVRRIEWVDDTLFNLSLLPKYD